MLFSVNALTGSHLIFMSVQRHRAFLPNAKSECNDKLIELWLQVRVHGTGRLLMFSSVEPSKCLLDGTPIEHEYDNHSSRLVVTLPKSKGLDHTLTLIL